MEYRNSKKRIETTHEIELTFGEIIELISKTYALRITAGIPQGADLCSDGEYVEPSDTFKITWESVTYAQD